MNEFGCAVAPATLIHFNSAYHTLFQSSLCNLFFFLLKSLPQLTRIVDPGIIGRLSVGIVGVQGPLRDTASCNLIMKRE